MGGKDFGSQEVNWTVKGVTTPEVQSGTSIDTTGKLTVAANETNEELIVRATSKTDENLYAEKTIKTVLKYEDIPKVVPGSLDYVTIDGVKWFVLAKETGKALIWSTDSIENKEFDTANNSLWRDSSLRKYLNEDWINSKTELKDKVAYTNIHTRIAGTDKFNTTKDRVFLLSEADLYGTHSYGQQNPDYRDYTYQGKQIPNVEALKLYPGNVYCWTRTQYNTRQIVIHYTTSTSYATANTTNSYGYRPAMWIEMP